MGVQSNVDVGFDITRWPSVGEFSLGHMGAEQTSQIIQTSTNPQPADLKGVETRFACARGAGRMPPANTSIVDTAKRATCLLLRNEMLTGLKRLFTHSFIH